MLFITDEANLASRQGKGDEPIDWDALVELASLTDPALGSHADDNDKDWLR